MRVPAFRRLIGILMAMIAVAQLAACAALAPTVSAEEAAIPLVAPNRRIALPLPAELGRSVDAVQMIVMRRDGRSFAFEARLSITPERFLLVGIDNLGRRGITIQWSAEGLSTDVAPWVPDAVRPGSVLADLVLVYWPESVVRQSLAGSGMQLVEAADARSISDDRGPVLSATYGFDLRQRWVGALRYRNHAWGYEVEVLSQELGS